MLRLCFIAIAIRAAQNGEDSGPVEVFANGAPGGRDREESRPYDGGDAANDFSTVRLVEISGPPAQV